jgi:hypothetical protein
MGSNTKKGLLIGLVVLGLAGAIFGISQFAGGDQPQAGDNVIQLPEGSRSMKEMEMEAQAGAPAADPGSGERDLAGGLVPNNN